MPLEHSPKMTSGPIDGEDNESTGSGFRGFPDDCEDSILKELTGLFRQRTQVKERIVNIQHTILSRENPTLAMLTVMSDKLSVSYKDYNKYHSKVMALIPDEALEDQADVFQSFEDLYDEVSTTVQELLQGAKNNAAPPASSRPQILVQQQPLKAPIPTFDGSYASWPKSRPFSRISWSTRGIQTT